MDLQPSRTDVENERVVLVGVQKAGETDVTVREALDELAQLVESAEAVVADRFLCRQREINPATFIGSGKAADIAALVRNTAAHTVAFDDDLSPVQGRNLEKIVGAKVVDRTQVILDIFARRAHTSEGRLQIELAQLDYLLPRLRRMWVHLERQRGGIGLRGPGEQQLELDRRRILNRITIIRERLQQVRKHREELRRGRSRHGWALICLVGYTNAGKSTLLNALTGSKVAADNKLFATLDPTTRRLDLPNHQSVLLTDTVGFIRKLPHGLVESFKATLEETTHADILLHVVDAAHPQADEQIDAVNSVLLELESDRKPVIAVLNKIDRMGSRYRLHSLTERFGGAAVAVSARTGEGLDALRDLISDRLRNRQIRVQLRVPLSEGKILSLLRQNASIEQEEYAEEEARIQARIPATMRGELRRFMVDPPENHDV